MARKRKGDQLRPADEVAPAPPPLIPVATSGFKRDYRLQASRGMDMVKVQAVIDRIVERRPWIPATPIIPCEDVGRAAAIAMSSQTGS